MIDKKLMLLPLLLTAVAACTPGDSTNDATDADALATVNGKSITRDYVDTYVQQRGVENTAALPENVQSELINQLVNFELLAQTALDKKLDQAQPLKDQLHMERTESLAAAAIMDFFEQHPVTDAMLQAEYDKMLNEQAGKEFRARHILVEDQEQAAELIARLDQGDDFAELAAAHSTEPGAAERGGDLGWFSAEQMVEPFGNAVKAMETGTYSKEPVETRFGWHVIQLEDVRDVPPPDFETVRAQLESTVKNEQIESYINDLRGKAQISVQSVTESTS